MNKKKYNDNKQTRKKIDNEKKIKKNRPESIQISTLNM
jgi:hypothetical protein